MPEFQEALDFPRPCDHLKDFSLKTWRGHQFVNLENGKEISTILDVLERKVGFLPIENFKHDAGAY